MNAVTPPPATGGPVAAYLHALSRPAPDGVPDGELLARFLQRRDELAFAELVRRHGPMVHAVCRRVAPSDADDAVQATFAVLVRRAGAFTGRATIGDFLHGVAYRTALKARSAAARRRVVEAMAARPEAVGVPPDAAPFDLDRVLAGLPQKHRDAVVLCDLEGVPRRAAAERLGVPEGTISSRLAAAHRLLARRLAGLGAVPFAALPLPAGLAAAVVRTAVGPAGAVPAAVSILATEVLRAMLITKLKHGLVAGVLAAAAVGAGVGVSQVGGQEGRPGAAGGDLRRAGGLPGGGTPAEGNPDAVPNGAPPMGAREARVGDYHKEIRALAGGIWVAKAQAINGQPASGADAIRLQFSPAGGPPPGAMMGAPGGMPPGGAGMPGAGQTLYDSLVIETDMVRFGRPGGTERDVFQFKLNPFRTPKEITLSSHDTRKMTQYIYELKGDKLRLAGYKTPHEPDRPYGFDVKDQPKNGADLWVIELELQKFIPPAGGSGMPGGPGRPGAMGLSGYGKPGSGGPGSLPPGGSGGPKKRE